jgi:tRNA modification GTPase
MPSLPYFCGMIDLQETICALSTPPGVGGIAVVRVSGKDAFKAVSALFSKNLTDCPSHKALHGWILDGEEKVDEVVVTVFRGPKSFTGEDTAEIACHGSAFIQQRIIELLLRQGLRLASRGEYTMRAYLNGRMDLSQAEAVGDLIASDSAMAHKQALHQMRGGFSKEINALRDRLIHFASLVELELDFAEEDVEFANRTQLFDLVNEIKQVVDHLCQSFRLGNAIKNGVPVAILGAPNMGKSTLLNALLNEDRAIVSDIAGTTRDTVEDDFLLDGIRFTFIDTAGIRETNDKIEQLGIERSLAKARGAAIALLLFDAVNTTREELEHFVARIAAESKGQAELVLVANKIDQPNFQAGETQKKTEGLGSCVHISAKSGLHMAELKQKLKELVKRNFDGMSETVVTNARHHEALLKASASLTDILNGMEHQVTGDFLAVDIRKTLHHLSEITGQINADDLLNSIFSSFCIGK